MRNSLFRMIRSMGIMAALVLGFGFFTPMSTAHAAEFDVEIPRGTREGAPGTFHNLATQEVAAGLQGRECTAVGIAVNQRSLHPNSDLFVRSGGTEVVLFDVEATPNVTVQGEGTLTLGDEIVVSVRFGEDGVFSGAMTVRVDCPDSGRIIVVKEVTEGSSTTQEFQFSASYVPGGFSLAAGEQHDSGELAAGEYSLSEVVPAGWRLESAVCDDSNSPLPEIVLRAGETVTCVFSNHEVPSEVGGAIVVTVGGGCGVVDDEAVGVIDVSIPVPGGAEVVITDSSGAVVETFTEEGTVTVPEGRYTWEATPGPGFEFPGGLESSGSLTIDDCADTQALPFTGARADLTAIIGLLLVAAGSIGVLVSRRTSEDGA